MIKQDIENTGQGIQIIDSGYVSRDDAAFPTVVKLKNGDLVCAFTAKGEEPEALG